MNIITLTDAAINHIKNNLAKKPGSIGFRLSVKKTGCSGYSYVPDLVDAINEQDIHFVVSEGLHVYVDVKSEPYLKGVMVDYVAENQGLKQKQLVFINPNEKNRCGCGESFTIE
ncbi:MAG: Fe-S cluster assembly protein [uncultured bacterium]|nr:MAG: Fe-S cluster assembly protein [uncultured bacterium]